MSALGLYLAAFLPKWWALVSGPALYGLDRFTATYWPWAKNQLDRIPRNVRRFIEISLFIVAIFYAGFSAWNDEHNNFNEEHELRIKAEARATSAEAGYTRQAALLNALKDFYTECTNLVNIGTFSVKTVDDYKTYSAQVNEFVQRLDAWITANMGEAAKARLSQISIPINVRIRTAINDDHNFTVLSLRNILANLDSLIQNPMWDKR
jgi:hypothetical protein